MPEDFMIVEFVMKWVHRRGRRERRDFCKERNIYRGSFYEVIP